MLNDAHAANNCLVWQILLSIFKPCIAVCLSLIFVKNVCRKILYLNRAYYIKYITFAKRIGNKRVSQWIVDTCLHYYQVVMLWAHILKEQLSDFHVKESAPKILDVYERVCVCFSRVLYTNSALGSTWMVSVWFNKNVDRVAFAD